MSTTEQKTPRADLENEMKKIKQEIDARKVKLVELTEKYEALPEVKKEKNEREKLHIEYEFELWAPLVEAKDKWAANWLLTTGIKLTHREPKAKNLVNDIGTEIVEVSYELPWNETIKIIYDPDEDGVTCEDLSHRYVRAAEDSAGKWESFIKNDFHIEEFDKENDEFGAERYLVPLFMIAFAKVLPIFNPSDYSFILIPHTAQQTPTGHC